MSNIKSIPEISRVYPTTCTYIGCLKDNDFIEKQPKYLAELLKIDFVDTSKPPISEEELKAQIQYIKLVQIRLLELISTPEEEQTALGKTTVEKIKLLLQTSEKEKIYNEHFIKQREELANKYPKRDLLKKFTKILSTYKTTGTNPQDNNSFYCGYFQHPIIIKDVGVETLPIIAINANKTKWLNGLQLLIHGAVVPVYNEMNLGINLGISTYSVSNNFILTHHHKREHLVQEFNKIVSLVDNRFLGSRFIEDRSLFIKGTMTSDRVLEPFNITEFKPKEDEDVNFISYYKVFEVPINEVEIFKTITVDRDKTKHKLNDKLFISVHYQKRTNQDNNYPDVKMLYDFTISSVCECFTDDEIDIIKWSDYLLKFCVNTQI